MLITLLLLAVLTIGAVSAADDVSDENLTVSEGRDDAIIPDDDSVSSCDVDDEIGEGIKVNITRDIKIPDTVRKGDLERDYDENPNGVTCCFGWDYGKYSPSGNFSILIDGRTFYTDPIVNHQYDDEPCLYLNKLDLGFGNHTLQVTYGGDDNYIPFTETSTYEYYYMKEFVPNPVLIGDWNQQQLVIDFTLNATGSLKVFVDDKHVNTYDVYEERSDDEFGELSSHIYEDLSNLNLAIGNHSYELRYSGGNYPDKTVKGNFTVDYRFEIFNWDLDNNNTVYLDEKIELNIHLVGKEGNLTLTLNGEDHNIKIYYDHMDYILPELALGKNNLTFTYENSKYPTKQKNYTVNAASRILFSEDNYSVIDYNSDRGNFSVVLPSNAKGNLSVYIEGYDSETGWYTYTLYKTAKLENGKAIISVSDLNLGGYYLYANYTGNDYGCGNYYCEVTVAPNVDYPKTIWSGSVKDSRVTAESPNDAEGDLSIAIYDSQLDSDGTYVIGNLLDTLYAGSVKGKVTETLPKLSSGVYYIRVIHSNGGFDVTNSDFLFEVKDVNPNISLNVDIPSELVIDYDDNLYWNPTNLPDDADGKLTLYIDGEVADRVSIGPDDYEKYEYCYSRLRIGNHNWTIEFSDDSYYNPTSINGTFKISKENGEGDISIDIENHIYMNDNDLYLATIEAPEDADGNISIYVGEKLVFNKNITDCRYDDEYECYGIYLSDIEYAWEVKSYRITVNYNDDGDYGFYNKSATVDVDFKYDIEINFSREVYKDENEDYILTVYSREEDAKGNITIKINGNVVYDQSVAGKFEEDDRFDIYLSDLNTILDYGTYSIEISYSGDEYVGEYVTDNLTVTYQFYGFIDDGMSLSGTYVTYPNMYDFEFVVPEGAKGKVTVTFNGETKEIQYDSYGGKYAIDTSKLKLGQYSISATYNGADYPEKTVTVNFTVIPKFSSPYQVSYNELVTFSAQVPDATGTLTLYEAFHDDFEGKYTHVQLASAPVKNGVATITMKMTREMDYYLEYTSGNYSNGFYSSIDIVQNSPEFKVSVTPSVITAGENVIVSIDTSGVKGTIQISVDGGNSEFIDIVNGKVTKLLSNLGVGQHSINIQYIDGYDDGEGNFVNSNKFYSNTFYVTVKAKPAPAPVPVKNTVKLTLKKFKTVKRSAKKLVLTATLKINGKPLKGKVIKFKFNKKTYKAKTNKKGVAKVIIKKKVLKKLKVGKKVKYQATYGKVTKKYTVKVKK